MMVTSWLWVWESGAKGKREIKNSGKYFLCCQNGNFSVVNYGKK